MKKIKFVSVYILLMCLAVGCKNNSQKRQHKSFKKNGLTVKGNIINDTIFDDTVYYYNDGNRLVLKEFYLNGKVDGLTEAFYENGVIKSRTNYTNGLKNGKNNYFDSLGRRVYSDYYYYNLSAGPVAYYDTTGTARRYYFISFDNRTLLDIDYDSWKGINDIVLDLINYSFEIQKEDSVMAASLFVYLMKPPKMATKYSLYKRNRKNPDDQVIVTDLDSELPFLEYSLPVLRGDYYYSIRLEIYDSIMNKKSVVNREVW